MTAQAPNTLTSHDELCEWPGCENPALCRSGNYDDKLVCTEHFDITNGTPARDSEPTLSIPLKYCTFEVWADQRTVATVFPSGHTCTGSRVDTQQNRTEAESQGYTGVGTGLEPGSGPDPVWRSLVEHELLHNVIAEIMFDRESLVMETESGKKFHSSWLRYEEEAIVLAHQYYTNTGRKPDILYRYSYSEGVYSRWFKRYVRKLLPLWIER